MKLIEFLININAPQILNGAFKKEFICKRVAWLGLAWLSAFAKATA
jgi:hypothetical protein